MATNRKLPRTGLALAVLNLLNERPMHPYEMKTKMKERGHDQRVRTAGSSIYDTVERLERLGYIEPTETSREGRRPERTVYRLTEAGRDEVESWMRELLAEPAEEYPWFGAALTFILSLRTLDEAVPALRRRIAALEGEIARSDSISQSFRLPDGALLPRILGIEEEYAQAMRRAELDFVKRLVLDLEAGGLWPEFEALKAIDEGLTRGGEG